MSEENGQAAATEAAAEQETTSEKPKPTETVEFWKSKAREQESRAKANADAAKRLEEIENASKTEQQRLTERVEAAENRTRELETHSLRLEIAAEKGLTTAQAKRLVGNTREELVADADELLETFQSSPKGEDQTEQVITSLDLGNRGNTTTAAGDPAADFAKFLKGQLA